MICVNGGLKLRRRGGRSLTIGKTWVPRQGLAAKVWLPKTRSKTRDRDKEDKTKNTRHVEEHKTDHHNSEQ
jgi:hypothetical protein